MVVKKRLACEFQKCVGDLWLGEDYHDFTVLVEDTSFQCHRFILSACSEFFRALLRTDMKENLENSTKLGGMTPGTFNTIINAIYKGEDGLTTDNVIDIWYASDQLQIKYLITESEDFVVKNLSNENYYTFYQHSKLLNSVRVSEEVEKFILKNFETFRKTSIFLELSANDLNKLVRSHDLNVTSEDLVLESVLEWTKHISQDSEDNCCCNQSDAKSTEPTKSSNATTLNGSELTGRHQYLKMMITGVRLHLVSLNILQNLLKQDIVLLNREVYDIVLESVIYQSQVECRHGPWPEAAIHRYSSDKQHVMVYGINNQVKAYSLNDHTFHDIVTLPENSSVCQKLCVFDNVIYIWQTYNEFLNNMWVNRNSLTSYSRSGNLSKVIQNSTNITVTDHLLSHGNYIYHLCLNNIAHRYRPENGYESNWTDWFNNINGITSAITYDKYILCFIQDSYLKTWVRCYDPEPNKSWDMSRLEGPMNNIVTFGDSKDTYLLQRNGVLTKILNTEPFSENFSFVSQLWSGDWEIYGAVLYRGELVIFGRSPQVNTILNSLPGVFDSIRLVPGVTNIKCWPMVLPKSCLK